MFNTGNTFFDKKNDHVGRRMKSILELLLASPAALKQLHGGGAGVCDVFEFRKESSKVHLEKHFWRINQKHH